MVDYNTPGGVDNEGWQYATDFPAPYHGKKIFTDCVRRRRWYRKAQINTEGPWVRAGNTGLLDISIWVCKYTSIKYSLIHMYVLEKVVTKMQV